MLSTTQGPFVTQILSKWYKPMFFLIILQTYFSGVCPKGLIFILLKIILLLPLFWPQNKCLVWIVSKYVQCFGRYSWALDIQAQAFPNNYFLGSGRPKIQSFQRKIKILFFTMAKHSLYLSTSNICIYR